MREKKLIETTTELAEIIKSAKPAKELKKKVTQLNRFFKPFVLRSMMSWERQTSPFNRRWIC